MLGYGAAQYKPDEPWVKEYKGHSALRRVLCEKQQYSACAAW